MVTLLSYYAYTVQTSCIVPFFFRERMDARHDVVVVVQQL